MSKHMECSAAGKFDCAADENVHDVTLDTGLGEGHVDAPSAWFEPIDLDGDTEPGLVEHYGTRWLIARENSQGRFWAECYDTEQAREERLEGLRESWGEWEGWL